MISKAWLKDNTIAKSYLFRPIGVGSINPLTRFLTALASPIVYPVHMHTNKMDPQNENIGI
jgi:hypothetical protein